LKKRRTPSKTVIIQTERKVRRARCAVCGKPLHGVPRLKQTEMRKLPKTKRRPERPYGGYMCTVCTREQLRQKARGVK
jgi:large subunit ribosomal protein L34e